VHIKELAWEFQFLKHIERCKTILHLIDITGDDIEKATIKLKMSFLVTAQSL
jgi:GTPase involved in cell partitioning and DNA repair